jgi:hypothetical protein
MAVSDDNLSRRAAQAISALLTAPTIGEAARQAGIGERTLLRWLAEDAPFQARYREARRAVVQQAITQVQQSTSKAVTTLIAVMEDRDAPASARVAAARVILEQALRGIELEDLETRIAALEQTQRGSLNGTHAARY